MEKINLVLVMLNPESTDNIVKKLNFDKVNLAAIILDLDLDNVVISTMVTDDNGEPTFKVNDENIPVLPFAKIHRQTKTYKDFVWLIGGYVNSPEDILKMKNFLMASGISEENIVNVESLSQVSQTWLANLSYIKTYGADFFATGNESMCNGLHLKFIPLKTGINLADANQTLRQSYMTAKFVFEHVEPGTIKFVLIGLTPDSFFCDTQEDAFSFLHLLSLTTATSDLADLADLNFDSIKETLDRKFSTKAILDWEGDFPITDTKKTEQSDLNSVPQTDFKFEFLLDSSAILKDDKTSFLTDVVEKNIQILRDYIKLCVDNGAKPVGVIFPAVPVIRKTYDKKRLNSFRETLRKLEKNYTFFCVDMFELNLNYDSFYDITHLNLRGNETANAYLSWALYKKNLIPIENFGEMSCESLRRLAWFTPKKEFNDFIGNIHKVSLQSIRRKNKIKVGFVTLEAAQWCGDDLYHLFVKDKRFETTVFFSLDFHKDINELVKKDFARGIEQFKRHGIEVVPLDKKEDTIPEQDILIFLTPYLGWLPDMFFPTNIPAKTLLIHIPYALDSSRHKKEFYNKIIFIVAWKVFFSSVPGLKIYQKNTVTGMSEGIYSGYPKMDVFFKKGEVFNFEWKMTRPDAKKIIWAPHHSIIGGPAIKYATFQWNYQFMYEFAKAHPETSWVVKPHPMLLYTSISAGIFSSEEEFKDYLQKWNDLPNALVYTGAYYQNIFATSDGMIHDCGSFISEYQYVNRPMIYLTRDTQWFNNLGEEVLKISYLVDGQDLHKIAETIKEVFIEGNDYKAAERKEIFYKYLNYVKVNGMLASEFIYKKIADEFQESLT